MRGLALQHPAATDRADKLPVAHRDFAAHGDHVRPTLDLPAFESAVIERERALQKSLAGECNETETTVRVTSHEISDGKFGALKTVWADVSGQHAAGTIENENNIFAERLAGFFLLTPLRPGESEANAGNCQD